MRIAKNDKSQRQSGKVTRYDAHGEGRESGEKPKNSHTKFRQSLSPLTCWEGRELGELSGDSPTDMYNYNLIKLQSHPLLVVTTFVSAAKEGCGCSLLGRLLSALDWQTRDLLNDDSADRWLIIC